ncbi:RraA family protein [Jannaschia aquimarina]|uniref:Putative 4-hydroxy-4-methyl-2-oxoglutarate aldolase n=1 Tax=Jannaschia aquimarina TaxID=935700 RepID=A0A0D1EKE5_9RHOB|nr:RraA family protein [Jannaschia aquimarina]KIT18059.1 4-hydroxy-4-methyl-2-oxoglutarate aldolase [Jannaschia aquimarina]SNS89497.1 Regulator of RNase E activity RraA [Jannaschia aquimarina]
MIEEPKSLTIARRRPRPDEAMVDALRSAPTGHVLDAMMGAGAMTPEVKPLPGLPERICGPALTVENPPGDILATLAGLELIEPGQVLVVGFAGYRGCAAAGDVVTGILSNAGGAGLVTDGPLRDLAGLRAVGLPAFCTGLTPGSPVTKGPGRVGLPVVLAGQRVATGDVIVGDADGVVVVPLDDLPRVVEAVAKVAAAEAEMERRVAEGLRSIDAVRQMIEAGDDVTWVGDG